MNIVENVGKIGDAFSVIWAFFQDESGQLTILATLLLATLALVTAYRCFRAMQPAFAEKLTLVMAIGSTITAVFGAVGAFFLIQAASSL